MWLGGYYANGEAPALSRQVPPGVSGVTLQTQLGNGLVISDAPDGGILIKTASGAFIHVSETGITHRQRPRGEGRDDRVPWCASTATR